MVVSLGRRRFITQLLGIVAVSSLLDRRVGAVDRVLASSSAPQPLREVGFWQFTGLTRCNANGFTEERWCYYECFGGTCTPVQYEWRATGRPC